MAHPTGTLASASGASTVVLNPPNPARLLESLRDSGYSNDAALADLVDNSIDAEANFVRIWIDPAKGTLSPNTRILIADDGIGMDMGVLKEALKLGSNTERNITSDLGKYGMGLITASVSMATRLVVYSRKPGGRLLKAVHDLQEIKNRNEFVVEIASPSVADERLWEQFAVDQDRGTIVVLENCDKLGYTNAANFVTQVRKHLGQVFRLFIAAKSKKNGKFTSFITVNDEPLYAIDPLMLEEFSQYIFPQTKDLLSSYAELIDDMKLEVPIDPSNPEAGTDTVRIRIVDLPDDGKALAQQLNISASNSGIYVMRNEREIAAAQTLGMYQKNFALVRFRAELHIPASLDRRIGINWMKHRIEPDQGLKDMLRDKLLPHIASERKKYSRRQSDDRIVDHGSFEALISKKAKLLTLPTAKPAKEEKPQRAKPDRMKSDKPQTAQAEQPSEAKQRFKDRCEFKEAHMTASGPLWEPDMRGAKIVISFNVDHPLWVKYVLENVEGEGSQAPIIELLHLFSYCLTTAELGQFGDEEYHERLINMRQQLSNNMRVLLT